MSESYQECLDIMNQQKAQLWGLTKRQKRWLFYGSLGGAGLYFLYKAYRSDSLQALIELRKQFQEGVGGYGDAFSLSSDLTKRVMTDLHAFMNSDENEVPQSLRQLAKLARSEEIAGIASRFAEAAAQGVMSACEGASGEPGGPDLLTRILETLSSDKGSNLVSLAVSMACRSTVEAYCEFGMSRNSSGPGFWQQILEFGTTPRGEQLYLNCAGTFVKEGTKVFMGSMEGVSAWEDFLNSLCKPERALAIDRMTRAFVNEAVVTFLRKSRYGIRQEAKHTRSMSGKAEKISTQPLSPDTAHSNLETAIVEPGCCASVQLRPRKTVSFDSTVSVSPTILASIGSIPEWTSAIVKMSQHTEFRSLVISVAKTATGESIRSSMLTAKELVMGKPSEIQSKELSKMSTRNLGAMLLAIFMPVIAFLVGQRSGV